MFQIMSSANPLDRVMLPKCHWLLVGASYYLARCLAIINFNIQRKLVNSVKIIIGKIYSSNTLNYKQKPNQLLDSNAAT